MGAAATVVQVRVALGVVRLGLLPAGRRRRPDQFVKLPLQLVQLDRDAARVEPFGGSDLLGHRCPTPQNNGFEKNIVRF
jgi:hypothetical protein